MIVALPYPPRAERFNWTGERVAWLCENYPLKGKFWCASELQVKEAVVRYKASALGLVARGLSDAWYAKQKSHAEKLRGRSRPAQKEVMRKAIHDKGLHIHSVEVRAEVGRKVALHTKTHGHPRGFLGGKHSAEARASFSQMTGERWARLTEEQQTEQIMKGMRTRAANGTLARPRPETSWKAGWREIGGGRKYYRSRWEANYARYLEWLKCKGQIGDWAHEPTTFWFEGIKRGTMSYLPDFLVTESSGAQAYHEVKGWMDDRSKTKIARMAKYHPLVKLIVIDSKGYRALAKSVAAIVPEWE